MGGLKSSAIFGADRRGWRHLVVLLSTTALVSTAVPARAFEIIDGSTQTVSGDGTGTLPNPWNVSGNLTVGNNTTGELTVQNGGTVDVTGNASIAWNSGSTGTVTVDGSGSNVNADGVLTVGVGGVGVLDVTSGASVTVGGEAIIGDDLSSSGSRITLDSGSTMTVAGDLVIASIGDDALTVGGGAHLDTTSDTLVGVSGGASGEITVTGAGSLWTSAGWLDLGFGPYGEGTLTISDGGTVSGNVAAIGYAAGSQAAATVTGAGSSWTNSDTLFVGNEGSGTLVISDGGAVNDIAAIVGAGPDAVGAATVTGPGSTWVNTGYFAVGASGDGTLTIKDSGTVTDKHGMIGLNDGSSGAVTVMGRGSSWRTDMELIVGYRGSGSLTIADGADVSADTLYLADLAGSEGTLNVGAAAGEDAIAAGALNTSQIVFGDGAGTVNFNHTDTNYRFDTTMTGVGTINQLSGVTVLTGDSSGFGGITNITGGALVVDGLLGGMIDVSGGVLAGSGTVQDVHVAGGSLISPGDSIGTLHVANITIDADTTYMVELSDIADLISASGTATLNGGGVFVWPYFGTAIGTRYTILTAAGGITGTFGNVDSALSSLFLSPELSYDSTHVYLTIAQTTDFDSLAETPNQAAAARGAQSLGPGALYTPIAVLGNVADARTAFDAISGEIHASLKTGLANDSHFVRDAVNARIRAAFGGQTTADARVLAYGPGGPRIAPVTTDRVVAWGSAYGGWGQTDSDGNAAALDRSASGFFLGADAPLGDSWRLGIMAGYGHASFDANARASSASDENYTLAAYSGARFGALMLSFGAANTWHRIDTHRAIVFPGFAATENASYNARTTQIFGETGYTMHYRRTALEPFAGLAYVNLHTNGYDESGVAGVHAGGSDTNTAFTTLGLRAAAKLPLWAMPLAARGMLGWRHAFGDVVPAAVHAFTGGAPFTVAGVPIARNAAVIEAGIDFAMTDKTRLGITYSGQFASGASENGVNAKLAIRF